MGNVKIIIHLINNKTIEINEVWFIKDTLLKTMNDGNFHLEIGNYIVPKSSINYIEFKESEEN